MENERRFHVTYTGSEVIRLGKAGIFMPGTTAYVTEEDARAAAALGQFKVEGLDGAKKADAPKPAPAQSSPPAPAAAAATPKDTPTGEVKLRDEEKKNEEKKDGKDAKKEPEKT